jgi:LemA protein
MWIFIAIIAAIVVIAVLIYNSLIRSRNRVEESWADIEVQLKRRYDLIPNLVNTVKGFAAQESGVLERVTEARTQAMGAQSVSETVKDENMLSGTLKSLFAVAENYPDLKSNQNFLQLQNDLTDTENKIQAARRFYNGNVRDFNTKIEVFPTNLFASIMGFTKKVFFDIDDNGPESQNVEVKF